MIIGAAGDDPIIWPESVLAKSTLNWIIPAWPRCLPRGTFNGALSIKQQAALKKFYDGGLRQSDDLGGTESAKARTINKVDPSLTLRSLFALCSFAGYAYI